MSLVVLILIQAAFYALLGMGYVLVYRATRVLDLAHGDLMVLGAYLFFQMLVVTGGQLGAAGAVALDRFEDPEVEQMRALYKARRDVIVPGLRSVGCEIEHEAGPNAGFFVWARTPLETSTGRPADSMTFAARLLREADTVVVPGAGFSPRGRDYIRIALTVDVERMKETVRRLARLKH